MSKKEVSIIPVKAKRITLLVVAAIIVAGIIYGALFLFTRSKNNITKAGGMTPQLIREVGQLVSLEFSYKDVIVIDEPEEFLLFGIWDIDPGEHILIVQYNGTIKLGIDCENLLINVRNPVIEGEKKIIEITLPEVIVIASETSDFETVFDKGIFTKKSVSYSTYFNVFNERRQQYTDESLIALNAQALKSAKAQLEKIVLFSPEIRDNYVIEWYG